MWGCKVPLVAFALIALGSTTSGTEHILKSVAQCSKRRTSPAREILCYTSVFDVQLLADSICSCTSLVHQNHDLRNLSSYDIVELRRSLKEIHPPLQFIISINDDAKTLRTSATVRQEAIAQIIAVLKEVDGVELNVTAGSKERLYNFVKSLKDEMIRKSYDKRILMTLPSKAEDLAKQYELKQLVKYVDLFTLPTDYLTDDDGAFVTFHPSRLIGLFDMLNTDSLVDLIIGLGMPKRKILVSLPASAYKFTLKDEHENAPRSETTGKSPVAIDRKQLCETINNGEWTVERDEDLTAPYAFQNKTWLAFEDKISVGIKGKYALLRDLAGLAVRNIENDMKTKCERPLTQEIDRAFTEFKRKSRQAVLNALEDELHQAQFSYPNQAKTSNFRVVRVVDTEGHIRAVRENTQTEFVCRRQGYFVHPKSCNRFYRCVKFNQAIEDYSVFEFDCPAGLSFDERTEVCVWPGSLPQGSPCPGSSEIAPVVPKRFQCPHEHGYYADPQNCRWFFACIDLGGEELMAFEFRCPYGLVFDEKKLVCEWPWLVPACSESGSAYARTEYDYRGNTVGVSTGTGVSDYITGGLPEYSVTAGAKYPGIDYSRVTQTGSHGVNYFGSTTGYRGEHVGISTSNVASGYFGSTGGSISSGPTYFGSSDINVGSIPPHSNILEKDSTGYLAPSRGIGSTEHTVSTSGTNIGYIRPTGGVNAADITSPEEIKNYSESIIGGYSGVSNGRVGEGVDYSRTPGPSYSGSTVGGYGETISGSYSRGEEVGYSRTPETKYFGSTGLSESPTNIRLDSTGPKYTGSSGLYTKSDYSTSTLDSSSYSASTDVHIAGHQPSLSETDSQFGTVPSYIETRGGIGITGSTNRDYSSSTAGIYSGKDSSGLATSLPGFNVHVSTVSGIGSNLQGTANSGRVSGIDFISGSSKSPVVTSGTSIISGQSGFTDAHFVSDNMRFSGVTGTIPTGIRYTGEKEYTIPVFIQQEEPIYPSIGTTAGVRDYTGTSTHGISITSSYDKMDSERPHLNVSVSGNEIPTVYRGPGSTTGTLFGGNNIEGSIFTSDSSSGTIFSHKNVPVPISTAVFNQGTLVTGEAQPGYVHTSIGTPGYVINEELRTVNINSGNSGVLIHGTQTPAISTVGPSVSDVVLQGDVTPNIILPGQTAPGISIRDSIQPGTIVGSTIKPYISQSTATYQNINRSSARGPVTHSSSTLIPTNSQNYKTEGERVTSAFNTDYVTSKYAENDIPDYRPTSAILPDSIVSGGRIEGTGDVFGSTLVGVRGSSTITPNYPLTKPIFTPSGFTKTGPTRTGITTAVLGGGGSYSVSTSESRPILKPENIGEKAFEGNVAGYTKSSFSNTRPSSTLTPPDYSSKIAPSDQATLQPGYSYPKPAVQLKTNGVTFSSTLSPTEGKIPVTTPTPFLSIEMQYDSPDITNVFGSKIPTLPNNQLFTPTIKPTLHIAEPEIYQTTPFEAAKIPIAVSTVRPIDSSYRTTVPTNIPVSVFTDNRFTQRFGSQTGSTLVSNIGSETSQRTDSSYHDYSSYISSSGAEVSKPGVSGPTSKYDLPRVTARPELAGVTYKKPQISGISYGTVPVSTTFRSDEEFLISSPETTGDGGSPTNLGISKDKIDKLITNYDRGTVKYTPNVYDTYSSSGFDSTSIDKSSLSSSATKSSFYGKTTDSFTTVSAPKTSSYEVTTKPPEGKGKVIVKWSDLHPILLGKLEAECTCKADPFATLRGPAKKLYGSSKEKVDLSNYDESDIYVDLEKDDSSEDYNNDYTTNYGDSSPQPYKISAPLGNFTTSNLSSSYLPVSSTNTRDFATSVHTEASTKNNLSGGTSGVRIGLRIGKKLKNVHPTSNSIVSNREEDLEIINGATDCARPGLFRHPSLCNKFYICHWDQWKKKFTLHIFNCPIHLTFDTKAGACNWPSKGPACQGDNLLV